MQRLLIWLLLILASTLYTPVVFAIEKDKIFIPLDYKPKTVPIKQLQKGKELQKNPKVAFQVDNYEDDWQRLWFILLMGHAELVERQDGMESR